MNKAQQLISMLLLFCSLHAGAQQVLHPLTGKLREEATGHPLPAAAVHVLSASDNKTIQSTITNSEGSFRLEVPAGRYHIRIAYISFKTCLIENKDVTGNTDLGIIRMKDDHTVLKSVDIVGDKSTMELQLDKKVFNVGKDILSKGGTANDILNNVPSVNVDAAGGVSLRGNSNVRILINGKPSMLSNNNGLEQLPASSIEKVEVITNPSARYEAQGGAGIINIVLKKNSLNGLNGSIQAGVGTPANYVGNLNLSYKTEKVNFFSNIGYQYRDRYGSDDLYQSTLRNGNRTVLRQRNEQGRNDNAYNIYLGGDYYINAKNTLTGSFYHNLLQNKDTTSFRYDYFNGSEVKDSAIRRFEHYREPQNYNQLELNYVRTFNRKDQKLTLNLQYDFWNDDENQDISQQTIFPASGQKSRLVTRDIESSNDIYLQSDFVTTFSESARLELGLKANLRAIRSEYWAKADEILLPAYDNKLAYNEHIYGAYAQYGNKIKRFSYLLGLRAEWSDIGISDRTGSFKADKNYIDFFPTVHLTYKAWEQSDIQLSYSRRINRPQFWQLNTFGGLSDTRNLTVGNPDLNPMYTNSFELIFLTKKGKFSLNPSLYYQRTTDYFQYILKQTSDGYFMRTPVNLDYENRFGLELVGTYNPYSWWRLSLDFNYYRFQQQGTFERQLYTGDDDTWFTRLNSKMRFFKNLSLDWSFYYRAKNQDVQSLNKALYRVNVAVSKDFFGDKISVTFGINNVFNSLVEKYITAADTYYLESSFRGVGRQTNLTAVYRFNRKKDQQDRLPD